VPEILAKRQNLNKQLTDLQEQNHLLQNQIYQMRGLANLGLAFSLAVHEINNVLTPLGSYAELALANPKDVALCEKVQKKTVVNCGRVNKILQNLIKSASGKSNKKDYYKVISLVDNVFDCIARDFAKDGITVDIQIDNDLEIYAVDIDIEHVLMNLILNARDSLKQSAGGRLTIKAFNQNDEVTIEVRDTGKGIEKQNMKKIFDPFFTTKSDDSQTLGGSGLGLSFCKQIMESYDGRITVESEPNAETTFEITFPKMPSIC
jgi:signal transduction histidine kinase